MKPRKKPSYEQVEAERDAALAELTRVRRILEVLGADASFEKLQGNPAKMDALHKAEEGTEYHVDNERQYKLFD
ncbi:hypothetical protein [Rufibacter soli]